MTTYDASRSPMSELQLTSTVLKRLEVTSDARLRMLMMSLVRHLHAFAREVRLTEEEWSAAIEFLTEVGHMCDGERQEFILLSDTLGFSSLVNLINHEAEDTAATEPTILGPFYVPSSPWREYGESMVEYDDGGEPAVLTGTVRSTSGEPIADAVIDVWQTAANGSYAVQQPDEQPLTNLRGRYRSRPDGRYLILTVRPVPYPIPDDGPVGRLLRATGRHPWRAAHIHVVVSAEGHVPVTSHIFDRDSDYLDSDTVFGVKRSLVRDFRPGDDGTLICDHDLVLEPCSAPS